jgi:hypothetical protein
MSKLTLTRFLYIYDEVIFSFMISLLKTQSIHECYFWISELFSSGYVKECWEIIWFIYYDFYYINTPDFIWCINNSYNNGEENLKNIWNVVYNLFHLPISPYVFITRQYNMASKEISYIYKGKKPDWLVKTIPSKYHALFRYINKKKYHFAVSSLPKIIEPDLFEAIRIYFNLKEDQISSIQTDYHNSYNNDTHKIWSILSLLIFNPHYINSKAYPIIDLSEEEYQEILEIHREPVSIPVNKSGETQHRNTLTYKCLYSIHPLSSSFVLMRDTEIDIRNCYCHHWEYYAYNSPIWKTRFDKYDINIDDLNRKIIFNNDDELEEFYGLYEYEPDELTTDVQNKLFGLLPVHNWRHFIQGLFPEELCKQECKQEQEFINEFNDEVKFKDEFKFNY